MFIADRARESARDYAGCEILQIFQLVTATNGAGVTQVEVHKPVAPVMLPTSDWQAKKGFFSWWRSSCSGTSRPRLIPALATTYTENTEINWVT